MMRKVPEGAPPFLRFTRNRSDGKKFDTIAAARKVGGKIGGSRIVRMDLLTGDVVDIAEEMKRRVIREWKGESA